ncbi:MAG: cupin domain-containing protein [Deltaproteobacteria bacterium]|nr:cupin domain-containing protein [Deltaproteobacteria bacterium]
MINVGDIVEYVNGLKGNKTKPVIPANFPSGINIQTFGETKMVSKPWGFELWLAHGTELPYALKMIYITKGNKTSLQYHKEKTEHNVVFAGQVRLYYHDQKTGEVATEEYSSGSIIQVRPPSVHRIEALTDVFLVEVSSNHLDDVVRLQDDFKRPDGKIESEHKS